ncbi:hypothetical protein [Oceaniglobus ichthyenteri]|uniref:hypothetical protein n=1 Tax=Oceaniglobus ichthyenteri TaxID=2136177 RepID=UPI000D346A6B|nr:hypothetical protein [Oceaniglobus ichthyenteri]
MVYVPKIYDWRYDCAPIDQVFRAGGTSTPGGMTVGGFATATPEVGGRYEVMMNFAPFAAEAANLNASWTVSRILNSAIMRVRLYKTVQLVAASAITGADVENGIPWANDEPWANGENWAWSPSSPITNPAGRGAEMFTADLSDIGPVLKIGHVIGFQSGGYDFAHTIMDIEYDGADVATVTVSPPLRRGLTTDDRLLYRPAVMVTCINAREVAGNFASGRHMQFGSAQFVEALL